MKKIEEAWIWMGSTGRKRGAWELIYAGRRGDGEWGGRGRGVDADVDVEEEEGTMMPLALGPVGGGGEAVVAWAGSRP